MPNAEYMRDYRSREGEPQKRAKTMERLRHAALRELSKRYPSEFLEIFNRLKREARL